MAFAGARPGVLSSAAGTDGLSACLSAPRSSALLLVASPRARALTIKSQLTGVRDGYYLSSALRLAAQRPSWPHRAAAHRDRTRVITSAFTPFADLGDGDGIISLAAAAVGGNAAGLPSSHPFGLPVLRPTTRSAKSRTKMFVQSTEEENSTSTTDSPNPPTIFDKLLAIWINMLKWADKHLGGAILLVFCIWKGTLTLKGEKGALYLVSVCEKAYKVYKLLSKALPILSDLLRTFR